jgi:hypothetical protein
LNKSPIQYGNNSRSKAQSFRIKNRLLSLKPWGHSSVEETFEISFKNIALHLIPEVDWNGERSRKFGVSVFKYAIFWD